MEKLLVVEDRLDSLKQMMRSLGTLAGQNHDLYPLLAFVETELHEISRNLAGARLDVEIFWNQYHEKRVTQRVRHDFHADKEQACV